MRSFKYRGSPAVKAAKEWRDHDLDMATGTDYRRSVELPTVPSLCRLQSVEQWTWRTGDCKTSVVEVRQNQCDPERLAHGQR